MVRDLVTGLLTRPSHLGGTKNLKAVGVNQVEVADQVGRPGVRFGDRQRAVETTANMGQLQAFAEFLKEDPLNKNETALDTPRIDRILGLVA